MTTPLVLSDDTVLLLGQFADTLDKQRPDAEMREEIRLARALVFAEQLHGPTEAAFAAEQDLLAAAPRVRPGQTRAEYAALLRLIARGVSAG
ncbi:hypothetical protein [Streptomyces globisporus]|uniref:hypothetical protein n=1 Tax=Streptomyces globisporus TaxID=1908 RepID=UPI0036FC9999|nr:hypothetical protein OG215_25175 [Streptomyces globisporus]